MTFLNFNVVINNDQKQNKTLALLYHQNENDKFVLIIITKDLHNILEVTNQLCYVDFVSEYFKHVNCKL